MLLAKVCLLGDGGVGKTALRDRYMGKNFSSNYIMTIGADFSVKKVENYNTLYMSIYSLFFVIKCHRKMKTKRVGSCDCRAILFSVQIIEPD